MSPANRPDQRSANQLRPITIQAGIAPAAAGSILLSCGRTQVICAASWDAKAPKWMQGKEAGGGWLTAEYSMLPYSTTVRKERDITRGKADGRTIEIQRLIGRALRSICRLDLLPAGTLWIDCDVLQADGGTRTASITGAYLAARLAVAHWLKTGLLTVNPFSDSVAAVSVGLWNGQPILDLCYEEDRDAQVDANIVMTGCGRFVELQASGEEASFTAEEWQSMLALAQTGLDQIRHQGEEFLRHHLS